MRKSVFTICLVSAFCLGILATKLSQYFLLQSQIPAATRNIPYQTCRAVAGYDGMLLMSIRSEVSPGEMIVVLDVNRNEMLATFDRNEGSSVFSSRSLYRPGDLWCCGVNLNPNGGLKSMAAQAGTGLGSSLKGDMILDTDCDGTFDLLHHGDNRGYRHYRRQGDAWVESAK